MEAKTVIPVAGIGASAGGLDVFRRLLGCLPNDTGFAFVVVQHLDPSHQSMLAEILARATSMPVSEAADGLLVEANHVYVIPPNLDLTLAGSALHLAARTQTQGLHMPIDRFLRSLADQCGSRAVGIILSGTGSDGAAGVEAIKAAGGVTFAQEPGTAKYAAMPQAAVATDCVDFVLPPEGIAAELSRIGRHPYIADQGDSSLALAPEDEKQFAAVLAILLEASGIDFSVYREKMVKRRILRRVAMENVADLAAYRERLASDPAQVAALLRDLLIGVTSFFRDPDSFEALKTSVFPVIFERRNASDPVRVWVAGCATGEEAWSLAILLREFMSEAGVVFPVQIFASDISLSSIERARVGRYPDNIAADLSAERLARNFIKVEGGYQIDKRLREMCIFAHHNLIDDPPFSKLDLITCRNVLIYLGAVRKKIIPLFHYALKPGGCLLLGASEAAASDDLFTAIDREHRIYTRRETTRRHSLFSGLFSGSRAPRPQTSVPPVWDKANDLREVDRVILSKYSPSALVVDGDMEVLELRGNPGPWLALPSGKASFHLNKLIPDAGLFFEVEKLILQSRETAEPVREDGIQYEHGGGGGTLNLDVIPIHAGGAFTTLVLFEPVSEPIAQTVSASPSGTREEMSERTHARLKQQLADAKERLVAVTEAHQNSHEESQNSTEEALSANEELQSLNEELETAREELQSTNEELITVNAELQTNNTALLQARDFAISIVESVRQPLVVLDADLRVQTANEAFYRAFEASRTETEGEPFFSLWHRAWEFPALRAAVEALFAGHETFPEFEADREFPGVGRRSLLFGGCRINHLKTILLAIDDITARKMAQEALRHGEEHLRQSQKMEALGRLAGGIAHDFNNLLTAILGYGSLLADRLAGDGEALHDALEINVAAERAASLTQQLLSFSRRQVLQPRVLDLNAIVADFDKMLRRLVGEHIDVVILRDAALWQVKADPGEIGRAIMNLCLNARDSMPSGGTLTIETLNIVLNTEEAATQRLAVGKYAQLAVHDTGVGIGSDVRAHIFEPFFTTKETGKGTGLGLATVLGIVEQSGGAIRCDSEPGAGTSFRLFLPAVAEVVDNLPGAAPGLLSVPGGTEIILLVEDEGIVRSLARHVLEGKGYKVREAANGREGLLVCEGPDPIDLLLTDVMMRELGGRELAEAARSLRPSLKVIFMSGHTEDMVLKDGVRQGSAFLQKPFTPAGLAKKVRETLNQGPIAIQAVPDSR